MARYGITNYAHFSEIYKNGEKIFTVQVKGEGWGLYWVDPNRRPRGLRNVFDSVDDAFQYVKRFW